MAFYTDIFFDLDGTLTDPGLGITNSVMHALRHYGIPVPPREELYRFIGPPLVDSFMRWYGFSAARAREAVDVYREHFAEVGLFENEVYPGVPEMLKRLRAAGRRLVVATSKPEPFALRILEHFGLAEDFDLIAGATMDETRAHKWEVIAYALARCADPPRSRVLMVGDREHDVLGARRCGLDCLGVLYGYGSRSELAAAGAAALAETPERVADFILSSEREREP